MGHRRGPQAWAGGARGGAVLRPSVCLCVLWLWLWPVEKP